MADLVRIDRKHRDAQHLAEEAQQARIEPRRFAFAKGVVEIEADFRTLEEGKDLDVARGYAVFGKHAGVVGAQGETAAGGHAEEPDVHPAARIGVEDPALVRKVEAVEFAVAYRGSVEDKVEHPAAFGARKPPHGKRRSGKFTFE